MDGNGIFEPIVKIIALVILLYVSFHWILPAFSALG